MFGFSRPKQVGVVRNVLSLAFLVAVVFFTGCLFVPEKAEEPSGMFEDNLNLYQIVSGTGVQFFYNEYSDLFENSDNLFIDARQSSFSTDMFVGRLRIMNREAERDNSIEYRWEIPSDYEFITMDRPTTLNPRTFGIVSQNSGQVFTTGRVRITIRHTGFRWQITEWEELDEISYFHPTLGGSLGN